MPQPTTAATWVPQPVALIILFCSYSLSITILQDTCFAFTLTPDNAVLSPKDPVLQPTTPSTISQTNFNIFRIVSAFSRCVNLPSPRFLPHSACLLFYIFLPKENIILCINMKKTKCQMAEGDSSACPVWLSTNKKGLPCSVQTRG